MLGMFGADAIDLRWYGTTSCICTDAFIGPFPRTNTWTRCLVNSAVARRSFVPESVKNSGLFIDVYSFLLLLADLLASRA